MKKRQNDKHKHNLIYKIMIVAMSHRISHWSTVIVLICSSHVHQLLAASQHNSSTYCDGNHPGRRFVSHCLVVPLYAESCWDLTQSFEVPWCMSDTFHKESGLMIEQCAIDNIALAKISQGPQRCVGGILLTCHNCMWDRCWFASAHISKFL